MSPDDPRVVEILTAVDRLCPNDPGASLELLIHAIAYWSSRYAGCAQLLGIAVGCLQTAHDEAVKFATERAS